MSNEIFIARQPIIDSNENVYAYELLFRDLKQTKIDQKDAPISNNDATVRVVSNALNQFGIDTLIDDKFAFINADEEFILNDTILSIPHSRFVIEILEHVTITPKLIERIEFLKDKGYTFALDDATFDQAFIDNFSLVFPYIDTLKIDITLTTPEELKKTLPLLQQYDFKLLAEKVETKEDFLAYKTLGCTLFQGYFFAKPEIKKQEALDPKEQSILSLTAMLNDTSTTSKELVEAFEKEPEISLQLVRYLNSASITLSSPIKSIRHAVMMLGKEPLKNWLLLIAFSKGDISNNRSALLLGAQHRAKVMEEVAKLLPKSSRALVAKASFIGLLSLLEALLQTPMTDILKQIYVDDEIKDALLHKSGTLGVCLDIAYAIEYFDVPKAITLAQSISITKEALNTLH